MESPIERVRYSLDQADKARNRAKLYRRMHDTLNYNTAKGSITIKSSSWSPWHRNEYDYELTAEECRLMAAWFYDQEHKELRRAESYEQKALQGGS